MLVMVTGCANQGARVEIEFTMPRGEVNTIVANDQTLPNWLMSVREWRMNYLVKGKVTDEQRKAVAIIEDVCRKYTKVVQPNVVAEMASNAVLMGAFSALGVGIGAHYLAKNIDENAYAKYGGIVGAASGAASGVMAGGGRLYTIQTCLRDIANANSQYGIRAMR